MPLNPAKIPRLFLIVAGVLALGMGESLAQKNIQGVVSDAETGETLPSANIVIEGTYSGTITNSNGAYSLAIPDSLLPAAVTVRYIGYHPEQRVITRSSPARQDIALRPSVTELGEITVTDEDPAIGIMREVIRRKQEWRKHLETYRAEAYTRQKLANDTSIVLIAESVSRIFWDKERGHRELIQSRRQTANIEEADNFAGASYLPNFYDDDIPLVGFDLVGITHPDALDYYDFKLAGHSTVGEQIVYKIEVTPSRRLQPLFEGTIYVLDEAYALLEVNLKPNEVVKFPPPIKRFNSYYKQQFNNYGEHVWLPADVRIDGSVKISMMGLEFPLMQFSQLSRITNYQINVPLPDSLYEKEQMVMADSASLADSMKISSVETIPLSQEEKEAYTSLDSTATLEKAFKPSGFLARFIDDDDTDDKAGDGQHGSFGFLGRIPGSFSPQFRFNRVDELYAGLNYGVRLGPRLSLHGNGGYSTGYERWGYGGGLELTVLRNSSLTGMAGISYHARTDTRYQSHLFKPAYTILPNLLGNANYFDYFRNEGIRLFAKLDLPRPEWSLEAGYKSENHSSLSAYSAYDILGREDRSSINPPIEDGHLAALTFQGGYNLAEQFPAGLITGLKSIKADIEYSSGALGSDFDYTTYRIGMDWYFNTFYRRRLFPNTLHVNLAAGTYSGILPPQKMGIVDATLGYFSPFGALKAIRNRPYEGEQYLSLFAEHNFRTVPFEALGLRFMSHRNIGLIIFGGLARTWLSGAGQNRLEAEYGYLPSLSGNLHTEAGISLNGLFGLLRVDFAVRLDEPAFLINYSLARMF